MPQVRAPGVCPRLGEALPGPPGPVEPACRRSLPGWTPGFPWQRRAGLLPASSLPPALPPGGSPEWALGSACAGLGAMAAARSLLAGESPERGLPELADPAPGTGGGGGKRSKAVGGGGGAGRWLGLHSLHGLAAPPGSYSSGKGSSGLGAPVEGLGLLGARPGCPCSSTAACAPGLPSVSPPVKQRETPAQAPRGPRFLHLC